ncbi:MAG TPA: hypothetical protein PK014_03120 [Thermoanaerobaculia bacterium]|nr:hypothetical protein [Thermoanaerobaculia bacterium]HUM29049.1 hypothetical protein [Thermoanaerobaculia bacterium]HXK67395.1 hypothetical protein [Thermoanaerobaculia bacterium]
MSNPLAASLTPPAFTRLPDLSWRLDCEFAGEEVFHSFPFPPAEHASMVHGTLFTSRFQALLGPNVLRCTAYRLGEEYSLGRVSITLLPGGRGPGSSQILLRRGKFSILYSGKFSMSPSPMGPPTALPSADIILMHTPSRICSVQSLSIPEMARRLRGALTLARSRGMFPVITVSGNYGRAQDVLYLLQSTSTLCALDWEIFKLTSLASRAGLPLSPFIAWKPDSSLSGDLLVISESRWHDCVNLDFPSPPFVISLSSDPQIPVDANLPWHEEPTLAEIMTYLRAIRPGGIVFTERNDRSEAILNESGLREEILAS